METKIAKRLERIFQKNIRDNMAKSKNNNRAVTDEQVELYNTINPLINSIIVFTFSHKFYFQRTKRFFKEKSK